MFQLNLYKRRRWLLSCLLLFMTGCENKSDNQTKLTGINSLNLISKNTKARVTIERSKKIIRQGDMILRTGNDFTSESLRRLSLNDKTYSHCGIATIENDSIFVYHSLGGEWNPVERLRKDPVELFCNPEENRGFGIFSFNLNAGERNTLDSLLQSWYKKGLMFDMQFDLTTDDRMYCTEFVSKAIETSTNTNISFATTTLNNFKFVSIDNLLLHKNCVEKQRFRY